METGQIQVVSGPFADLIRQFSLRHRLNQGAPGSTERLAVLGSLLDTPRSTTEGWFKKDIPPTAGKARKVELLLSLCGFEADERKGFSNLMRIFADTLSTVVSVEDAARELGLAPDNLHIWLRGQKQPKDVEPVIRFNEKYADRRQAKIKVWRRTLQENGFVMNGVVPVLALSTPQIQNDLIQQEEPQAQPADDALVHLLKATRALVHSSGVLSDESRKKAIRQAVGHGEIAELIGDLQRLSLAAFTL